MVFGSVSVIIRSKIEVRHQTNRSQQHYISKCNNLTVSMSMILYTKDAYVCLTVCRVYVNACNAAVASFHSSHFIGQQNTISYQHIHQHVLSTLIRSTLTSREDEPMAHNIQVNVESLDCCILLLNSHRSSDTHPQSCSGCWMPILTSFRILFPHWRWALVILLPLPFHHR